MNKTRAQYTPEFLQAIERHLISDRPGLGVRQWRLTGGADPRFIGTDTEGDTVSVDIRTTGYVNAARFRGWLTLSPGQAEALRVARPGGWRFYMLMVGLLPDGDPWWTALWDLRSPAPIVAAIREVTSASGGVFYRVDPGDVPVASRPDVYDFLQPVLGLVAPVPAPVPGLVERIESWEASIPQTPDSELAVVDQTMLRVRRMIRSESERRARTRVTV